MRNTVPERSRDWHRYNELYETLVECIEHPASDSCVEFVRRMRDCADRAPDGSRGEQEIRFVRILNASSSGRMCTSYDDFEHIARMIERYEQNYGLPLGGDRQFIWEHRILSLYRMFDAREVSSIDLESEFQRDPDSRPALIQRMVAEAGFRSALVASQILEVVLGYQRIRRQCQR